MNVTEDDSVEDVVERVGDMLEEPVDKAALLTMMGGELVVGSICKLQAGATLKAEKRPPKLKVEDLTFASGPTECVEGTVVNVT